MSDQAEKLAKFKQDALSQLEQAGETDIDDDLLSKLTNNMRVLMNNKDALHVAASDPKELETVRKNFVVKKLEVEDVDKGNAAIKKVAEKLSASRMKNRAAFYYLVQKELAA